MKKPLTPKRNDRVQMDGSDTYYVSECTIYLPNRKRRWR